VTRDVVALTRDAPDVRDVVAGMIAAGQELRVRAADHGPVIQLCDDHERLLVSIEVPVLVQVPGEVERLLGAAAAEGLQVPLWWVEARAPSGRPDAEALARRFATELVRRLGGSVWPPEARPEPKAEPRLRGADA
jgi:hypothetical protein